MSSSVDRSPMLTAEELRVVELSATGLIIVDVAEAMGVSPEIVRVWLSSAIRKLGACSKLEAVLIAVGAGLIEVPAS